METIPRSLPPGKLYHVFFSHCNEDREWVHRMVDRLESPEYGFKCCYADRDFDLGIPVFQNITKCIHTSKRTVIVMSPEFLESPWCSYETRITLELDLDTRQRLLIPVMLRNCRVPDFIGRLTYMEVQNEHFLERFVAAIKEDDSKISIVQAYIGSSANMTGAPFQFNPHFHNAVEIVEVTVYQGCNFCSVSPSDYVPNELMRNGLQATHSISRAIEKANRIAQTRNLVVIVKEYGWCSCTCDKMAIIFYYYDWKPCHSHLVQFLTDRYRTTDEIIRREFHDRGSIINQEELCSTRIIQDEAWDLLVKHATEYCQLLLNRRSMRPDEQRHTRQGECLCQFVESILVSGETSCCDCIFGARSRHPWRRYCLF